MNPQVDIYLVSGCGRCSNFNTPLCKVNNWRSELEHLRQIVLECGLTEELKWRQPCYIYEGSNILLIAAFKEYCIISFFKGVLLKDPKGVLVNPGENSQAVRQFRFTDVKEIVKKEAVIKKYIKEAIAVEKAGLKINFKEKTELKLPEELLKIFQENPAFEEAFKALTPGRQRAYNLYFSAAKQSKTRISRIQKYTPQIMKGIGLNDRYK